MVGSVAGNAPGLNITTLSPERPRERGQEPPFAVAPDQQPAERQARREALSSRPVLPSTANDRPRLSREDGSDLPLKSQEAIRAYQQVAAPGTPQPDAAQLVGIDTYA